MIEFDDVSLAYGSQTVVRNVNLTIRQGEFVCLIGPSGCGKTSLLRMLGGLVSPTGGTVRINSKAVRAPSSHIGFVFQDYGRALLSWRTAFGNVALPLEAKGVAADQRKKIVLRLLEVIGLGAHANKYPAEMSGGMQQRLQIARCLAQDPDILLMDEPFGSLDAMTRQNLQDEVLRLAAARGVTTLFVTHDLDEAIYLSDRVVTLSPNPGRIGKVVDVALERPRDQLATREHPEFLRLRRELFSTVERRCA
jgi:NitT/TauT family transport system ATP-binding protein